MKPKKTDFESLKREWYNKLKEDGFVDIEQANGTSNSAVPNVLRKNDYASQLRAETTREYYCMAYYFLNEHKFENELEKVMWEYHTEGLSFREIAKVINDANVKKISKDIVWRVIKRLEDIMKDLYLSA